MLDWFSVKRQADIITIEEENTLWHQKILGRDSSEQLLNTVFYVIGLYFALRGGEEHRSLRLGKVSQISQHFLPDGKKYLMYVEHCSKTHQGGLNDYNNNKKCVKVFENANKERCPIHIYETYLSHLP